MTAQSFLGKLCLFSILCPITLSAPVIEQGTHVYALSSNESYLIKKRVLGDQNNPFPATFNIAGWPNIAEEDCYVMLCLLGGQRTL